MHRMVKADAPRVFSFPELGVGVLPRGEAGDVPDIRRLHLVVSLEIRMARGAVAVIDPGQHLPAAVLLVTAGAMLASHLSLVMDGARMAAAAGLIGDRVDTGIEVDQPAQRLERTGVTLGTVLVEQRMHSGDGTG